jgi:hypothetical protein
MVRDAQVGVLRRKRMEGKTQDALSLRSLGTLNNVQLLPVTLLIERIFLHPVNEPTHGMELRDG